jgi:membrane protease YdiL (CAAX protease family)
MQRAVSWIGLIFALIIPTAGLTRFLPEIPGIPHDFVREGYFWGLWLLILVWVLAVERRPLASIGIKRPTWKTLAYGVLTFVTVMAAAVAMLAVLFTVFHISEVPDGQKAFYQLPYWFRFLLVTRAAVVEETLFRGYGIERLQELTGSPWLAGIVTYLFFVGAHLNGYGWIQLCGVATSAVVVTLFYFWRRDLISNMVAHWLMDALGLLLRA